MLFQPRLTRETALIVEGIRRSGNVKQNSWVDVIHASKRICIHLNSIVHFLSPVPNSKQTPTHLSDDRSPYAYATISSAEIQR